MRTGPTKPTVFVSSTIGDFADLRGALKFWLEEGGFEVWLSEYNDIEKLPDANTFEACFASVRASDFYVLMIGDRRGALYSESDQISVTRQEYREAYKAFVSTGRPIPIMFARSRVMDMLRGWQTGGRPQDAPFPDALAIAAFASEVSRNHESEDAVKGIGAFPLANWLHRFASFREIVDALKVALALRVDVSQQRILAALALDLEVTLASFIAKVQIKPPQDSVDSTIRAIVESVPEADQPQMRKQLDGALLDLELDAPLPHHRATKSVVEQVRLSLDSQSDVSLTPQQRDRLGMFLMGGAVPPDRLWLEGIRNAATSGFLLRYDPPSRSLQETELSEAITALLEEAALYCGRYSTTEPFFAQTIAAISLANRSGDESFTLPWESAVQIWGLHFAQVNLYRRAASIYAYIRGRKESPCPEGLVVSSPFGEATDAEIEKEQAGRSDVRTWVNIPSFWNL